MTALLSKTTRNDKNVRKTLLLNKVRTQENIRKAQVRRIQAQILKGGAMSGELKLLEYAFNPYKLVDSLYNKNSGNYRMHKFIQGTKVPVWSWWSGALVGKMEDDEQLRYVSDLAKNTGVNPDNWKYPIRMGKYGNVSGYSSSFASTNKGIMNLYRRW